MRKPNLLSYYLVDFAVLLHIILFAYAALSKAMDYHHFQIEMAKSPLLSAYAQFLPAVVIFGELFIVLLLLFPRFRRYGLLGSFGLMVGFTCYIIIILNWSSFIPCSCGGILSRMGWHEHLIFNLFFVLLSMTAFLMYRSTANNQRIDIKRRLVQLSGIGLSFVIVVILLFLSSEEKTHRNNGFIRRYPHQPAKVIKGYDLRFNSYYLAGTDNGIIYLGNITAPAHVLAFDTTLTSIQEHTIVLKDADSLLMASPKVVVTSDTFILSDGESGTVFRGSTLSWQGEKVADDFSFLDLVAMSHDSVALSYLSKVNGGIATAVLDLKNNGILYTNKTEEQFENVFASDGQLLYNASLKKLVYLYYYRNEFVVCSPDFKNVNVLHSIDTLQRSILPVTYEKEKGIRALAAGAEMIHVQGATAGNYLLIKSNRLGRFESANMLDDASIIDVYDLQKQTYEFSFYLYNYRDERIKSFMVCNDLLVGLSEHYLVLYRLDNTRFHFSANDRRNQ